MASSKNPPREPGFRAGSDSFGPDDIPPMYADEEFQPVRPIRRPENPVNPPRTAQGSGPVRPEFRPAGATAAAAVAAPAASSVGETRASATADGAAQGAPGGAAAPAGSGAGQGGGTGQPPANPASVAAAVAAATTSLNARLAELERELTEVRAQATESQDSFLRASAEIENVRRRGREDVAKAQKFAIESFAESLVPVKDSLEMALKVETPTVEGLREGVETTLRQLSQAFQRNQLIEIDPLGQKFDPNLHQAISMAPSREVPSNHVLHVLQKGYLINDRVLRPALVTVSQGG